MILLGVEIGIQRQGNGHEINIGFNFNFESTERRKVVRNDPDLASNLCIEMARARFNFGGLITPLENRFVFLTLQCNRVLDERRFFGAIDDMQRAIELFNAVIDKAQRKSSVAN